MKEIIINILSNNAISYQNLCHIGIVCYLIFIFIMFGPCECNNIKRRSLFYFLRFSLYNIMLYFPYVYNKCNNNLNCCELKIVCLQRLPPMVDKKGVYCGSFLYQSKGSRIFFLLEWLIQCDSEWVILSKPNAYHQCIVFIIE